MYFIINKLDLEPRDASHLKSPLKNETPIVYYFYHTKLRTIACTIIYKKVAGEFRNAQTGLPVWRTKWTPEMKAFHKQQMTSPPIAYSKFKFTIMGYILIALFAVAIFMIVKPNPNKKKYEQARLETMLPAKVQPGQVLWGEYMSYDDKRIPTDFRTTWAKVGEVNGDVYTILLGKEFSKKTTDKDVVSKTEFETEGIPMKIVQHEDYYIRFKSADGKQDFSAREK